MKINKFKSPYVAICCLVASLWSETQGMDQVENLIGNGRSMTRIDLETVISISLSEIELIKKDNAELRQSNANLTEQLLNMSQEWQESLRRLENIQQQFINLQLQFDQQRQVNENLMTQLTQENSNLRSIIDEFKQKSEQQSVSIIGRIDSLEGKINPVRPLRAVFRNTHADWVPYTTSGWLPVTFNRFEGDERLRGNLSTIIIPEDGFYSLYTHYCWRANAHGSSAPYTAIAIGNPNNIDNYFVFHHLAANYSTMGGLSRDVRLKAGDKVMVSIQGSPNAEYFLGHFQFNIEKK